MLRLRAILGLCLCSLALSACTDVANGPGMISQRIGKLTSFGWDRFAVFKPGTTRESIGDFIGAKRPHGGRIVRYTIVPEDREALAFALNNSLTHIERHALTTERCAFTTLPSCHTRSEAVLRIHRETSERIWLEPK